MEFLQEYGDFAETGDDEEEIEVQANSRVSEANTENACLRDDAVRQVYLVTYSQANLDMFPTRRSFAEAVVCSFSGTTANVLQWVCCREPHIHGGSHYHLAIKLDRCQRWLQSKQYLQSQHDISVHFSNLHHNYFSAWKYVTKSDEQVLESEGHPDLWNSKPPKTNKACSRKRQSRNEQRENHTRSRSTSLDSEHDDEESTCSEKETNKNKRKGRRKRLSAFELSEIIVERGIQTRTELLAFANKQKMEGKTDIAEFIVNRGPRVVAEVLSTAWELQTAQEKIVRSKKSRIEILQEAEQGECVTGCNGQWLSCATEVLQRNGVREEAFTSSVKELLEKGRGKYRNIMICGPANCGKTFLLNPLNSIFNTFVIRLAAHLHG